MARKKVEISKDFGAVRAEIDGLAESKKEIALNILDKAEFMAAELGKLQEVIKVKGWVEEYQNGANQRGFKKSTEGDAYNTLIKNYIGAMKQLNDILPDKQESVDALTTFLDAE